jgi:hypothetical protein
MLIKTTDFRINAPALLFDPEYFVFDFALDSGLTKFLVVDESNLRLAPFTDIRFEPLAQAQFAMPTKELFGLERMHNTKRPQTAFIFHHAFVCSTLLARCLDQIDDFFSLKEPWILRRLADLKRTQGRRIPPNQWREMFSGYLGLLANNYKSGKTPVIKVTNVANNLITDVLKFQPDQKILYLYSDLESFLVSNLKKPRDTQEKMPDLAVAFLMDGDFAQKFPAFSNVPRLNFLQVCSLIWLVNLYNFQRSVVKFEPSNIKTLEMTDFLTNMAENLQNLSKFFGHEASANEVEQMMDPGVTETDAKHQDKVYGRESKQQETAQVLDKHGNEIGETIKWIKPLIEKLGILEFCVAHQLGS